MVGSNYFRPGNPNPIFGYVMTEGDTLAFRSVTNFTRTSDATPSISASSWGQQTAGTSGGYPAVFWVEYTKT
jgi:hypothetical protein